MRGCMLVKHQSINKILAFVGLMGVEKQQEH